MMKKRYLIIFLVIILFGMLGSCVYADFIDFVDFDSTFKVGNTEFVIPEGYSEGNFNEFGATNITNGTNSIFILENNDTNVMEYVHDYENYINNTRNQSMNILTFTIDDMLVYKTDNVDNPNIIHYWFVKNNKTYDIYTWDGNEKIDSIVISMIKSSK